MKRQACALIVVCAFPALGASDPPHPRPTASFAPTKSRYVDGEPIAIVITVTNPSPLSAEFSFTYPGAFVRDVGMVRFDGGPSMPRLHDRVLIGVGGLFRATTTVPPGRSWSKPVYLQNYLRQPPPGDHTVRYHMGLGYRLGDEPEEFRKDAREMMSIEFDGEIRFTVTPADPAELERVLTRYEAQFRAIYEPHEDRRPGFWETLDALGAVQSPAVIPHLARVLEAFERFKPASSGPEPEPLFQILEPFRDREDARRVVIACLKAGNPHVVRCALEWLRFGPIAIDGALLIPLLGTRDEPGPNLRYVLFYLYRVPIVPHPELRLRLLGLLPRLDGFESVAQALIVLARWNVPRVSAISEALAPFSEPSKLQTNNPFLGLTLEVLAAWHVPVEVEALRALFRAFEHAPIPPYAELMGYLQTQPRDTYRVLLPEVAALLRKDPSAVPAALRLLDLWDYRLSESEVERLEKWGGKVREATLEYLKKHPAR